MAFIHLVHQHVYTNQTIQMYLRTKSSAIITLIILTNYSNNSLIPFQRDMEAFKSLTFFSKDKTEEKYLNWHHKSNPHERWLPTVVQVSLEN